MSAYENEVTQQVVILGGGGAADRLLKARMSGVFNTTENNYLMPEYNSYSAAKCNTKDKAENSKTVKLSIICHDVTPRNEPISSNKLNYQQIALVCVDLSNSRALETMKKALQSAERAGISNDNVHIVALSDDNQNKQCTF